MSSESYDCPTCGKALDTETGMKIHHSNTHGESIAKKQSECMSCGVQFKYYPSNREGRFCHDCSDRFADDWGQKMRLVKSLPGNKGARGMDGTRHKKARIRQIKKNGECEYCGYDDGRALQFHHTSGNKKEAIHDMQQKDFTWAEVKEELKKCSLICANCHWVEHSDPY